MKKQSSNIGNLIGGLFILAGAVLLLDNLDILELPYYFFSWGTFLIILGLIIFLNSKHKTGGIIVMVIGLYFLLPRIFGMEFWSFWPLLLILIGGAIFFRGKSHKNVEEIESENLDSDYIDDIAIFGGGEKMIRSENFKGGKVTAIFGGSEISLQNSKLAEGKHAIELFCLFGGTSFHLPREWNVKIDVFPIFGGYSDKRIVDPNFVPDPSRELIIKGVVIFGGGEIKVI